MTRVFLATLIVAAAVLTMPEAAAQTSGCNSIPSLETASRRASAVFVGKARNIDPASNEVVFDVDWQWKGAVMPAVVDVQVTPADDLATSAASRLFTSGRNYLVFTQNAFEPFVIDSCAPSQPYVSSASVIPPNLWVALDNDTAYRPSPVVSSEPSTAQSTTTRILIGIIATIGLALGIRKLVVWRRRRREDGPKPFKMSRVNREYLEAQTRSEAGKRTSADKSIARQRRFSRRRRRKRNRAAAKAAKSRSKVGAE